MKKIKDYLKCSKDRWKQAQEWELNVWKALPSDASDWNEWWASKFDNYNIISDRNIKSILEVGCGPFAKNIQIIISNLKVKPEKITVSDPLLDSYIEDGKSVKQFIHAHDADYINKPLEDFSLDKQYDLIVCINVLDHVYDAKKCMDVMYKILNPGGIIIIGQDLTGDQDLINDPNTLKDIGHPIKLDHVFFEEQLRDKYKHINNKILPRHEGRNIKCHYGALIYIGEKI